MEDQHDAAARQFLQHAYFAALYFQREPDQFERLKLNRFWKALGQKPNDASTSKWVLYFSMRARTKSLRHRADKYAAILDGLMRDKVMASGSAEHIKQMGGVEAAYESMCGQRQRRMNEVTKQGLAMSPLSLLEVSSPA
jgi:hypothetical protein